MSARRGACPTLAAPMATGDGLLARITPVDGILSLEEAAQLCHAADRLGNGWMGVTQRGNLQIRGLTPKSAVDLAKLGIATAPGPFIAVNPLSGLDPQALADMRPLAAALRRRLANRALPPKFCIALEDGGKIHLAPIIADIRVTATKEGLQIGMERRAHGPAPLPPVIGRHGLTDGSLALGLGLPFGEMRAAEMNRLVAAARRAGARALHLAPCHGVLVVGLEEAAKLEQEAESLGFITRAGDPRRFVAACPGKPACASGHFDGRAAAAAFIEAAGPLLDGSLTIHLSACPKGCAHPRPADLTIVGRAGNLTLVGLADDRTIS